MFRLLHLFFFTPPAQEVEYLAPAFVVYTVLVSIVTSRFGSPSGAHRLWMMILVVSCEQHVHSAT